MRLRGALGNDEERGGKGGFTNAGVRLRGGTGQCGSEALWAMMRSVGARVASQMRAFACVVRDDSYFTPPVTHHTAVPLAQL